MLIISTVPVTPFMQNARILLCSTSMEMVVVDPGGDVPELLGKIKELEDQYGKANLKEIWLTHSHLDHCGGVKKLLESFPVDLLGHADEKFMRENVSKVAAMYGVPVGIFDDCPEPNKYIKGGETLRLGEHSFDTLFTPGHSPGHLSLYSAANKTVIAGDVLFAGSIGRTDLPGGDYETLIRSVREKLFVLPADTKVLCGHGADTTIATEISSNPFFQ